MNIAGKYMTQTQFKFPENIENLDVSRKAKNTQLSYARRKHRSPDLRDKHSSIKA